MDARDALAMIGITSDGDIEEVMRSMATDRSARDQRICLCGHGASRHTNLGEQDMCQAGRLQCDCKKFRPVGTAQDTRMFMHRSDGSGFNHALTRGITKAAYKGQTFEWLEDWPHCTECGSDEGCRPVLITEYGRIVLDVLSEKKTITSKIMDAMLCETCYERHMTS